MEEDIKQYKIDLANKIEDILSSLDEHKFNDDRVYPILITTLLEDSYGEVFCSGTSTDDAWFTFLDNVEREENFIKDMGIDNYHALLDIKPYEYDHELQGKLIDLYCFMFNLEWDFIYSAWDLKEQEE
jgi:hypothetical protein|tara:strand:+ start:759 stop:1142 length:384 start_codon:yes stop_codon:yes gene_type:complete